MNSFDLSNREEQVLQCLRLYIADHNEPPTPQLLAEMMLQHLVGSEVDNISDTKWLERQRKSAHRNILTVIARLEKKKYVERKGSRVHPITKTIDYYDSLYETTSAISAHAFLPARVKLRGYVTAGRTDINDLDINLSTDALGSIPVPNAKPETLTYALKVKGSSMEHEGIYEGDYIIVEEFKPSEWPKDGEMIVTRYVEMPLDGQSFSEVDIDRGAISGHTLKIYQEVYENGKRYHRLSWKKEHNSNPYLIKAAHIEPVGRVIGIYRSYREEK